MRKTNNMKQLIKTVVVILIVVATFVVFGYYIAHHPEVLRTLLSLSIPTLGLLAICYLLTIIANGYVLLYSLRFLGKKVPLVENIALTGYSSIVNFFGPLQSGPGVRAVYLKKRHGVKLRDFLVTTLIFYGFFAIANGIILLIAAAIKFHSPLFYLCLVGGLAATYLIFHLVTTRIARISHAYKIIRTRLNDKNFWLIGLGAISLSLSTALVYFIEINHVNSAVSFLQTLVYTAAANLALFVSLTPGAIGIRESFLVLSQQLHGIDTATVIGASVIDRAFYVAFLLVLFVVLLVINSRAKLLNIKRLKR